MLTTGQIASLVQGRLVGPADLVIEGMNTLQDAGSAQITFIRDPAHAPGWATSKAGAAVAGPEVELKADPQRAIIHVADADLAVAIILEKLAPPPLRPAPGIHPTAVVSPEASLGANVSIGPCSVIERGVKIGDGCVIAAQVTLEHGCVLGRDCHIHPGVVIGWDCVLGDRCILHPNVVIGADGFGYRPSPDGKGIIKIPQIGVVRIGHDVEIGAGTCVDRAKFAATIIADQTKIDNQCQIAHNCVIGRACILAGQVGLAGSVTLGDGVVIGGQTAVKDHVTIGAGASIAACSAVMQDMPAGATWGGYPAQDLRAALREVAAVRKLPDLMKLLRKIQQS